MAVPYQPTQAPPEPAPGISPSLSPAVVAVLLRACQDYAAEAVERLALFEAAIVAADLRPQDAAERLGVLAQNPTWGPAAARLDPYTAATVFLREAGRVRIGPRAPRGAARLAARVQGAGAWPYRRVARSARRILAAAAAAAAAVPTQAGAPVAGVRAA
jgi:hypothetical protein